MGERATRSQITVATDIYSKGSPSNGALLVRWWMKQPEKEKLKLEMQASGELAREVLVTKAGELAFPCWALSAHRLRVAIERWPGQL